MATAQLPLTPRQLEFVVATANGVSLRDIAERAHVEYPTARNAVAEARSRLGATSNAHLVVKCIAYGLLDVDRDGAVTAPAEIARRFGQPA